VKRETQITRFVDTTELKKEDHTPAFKNEPHYDTVDDILGQQGIKTLVKRIY